MAFLITNQILEKCLRYVVTDALAVIAGLDIEGPRLVLGREVAVLVDGPRPAGSQQVSWDGRDAAGRPVSSGVYFARLTAGGFRSSQKLMLLK